VGAAVGAEDAVGLERPGGEVEHDRVALGAGAGDGGVGGPEGALGEDTEGVFARLEDSLRGFQRSFFE